MALLEQRTDLAVDQRDCIAGIARYKTVNHQNLLGK
jgi:hypothetical protein